MDEFLPDEYRRGKKERLDSVDEFLPDDYMLCKEERLDPRLGPEIRTADLNVSPIQRRQENNTGKISGIVLKGVFFAIVMALLPLIQKQSPQLMHYTNNPSITRSWDLIPLLVVGLAVSYGLIARRPAAVAEKDENEEISVQGTQDYVQNMFDFASVFDDINSGDDVVLTKNRSMWRPEEPLHVIADNEKENVTEKPLLLPIRSLKHSLSNPQAFDFLCEKENADVSSSTPAMAAAAQSNSKPWKSEVRRNGELFSVESGNFEEELSNILDNDEPAVFRSPIPWSSRREIINNKTPSPPAPAPAPAPVPAADNLWSYDRKIDDDVPAVFPSPIPWSSRLNPNTVPPAGENKPSDDGKQKINGENPQSSVFSDKQDCKPQVPPSRPPPPPPPPPPSVPERQPSEKNFATRSVQTAAYPSPRSSPSPSVSPSPRPRPSPSPSPSPTPRQTHRPSPSPSPRQTPRPSPSPTRPRSVRQADGNPQSSSGIPLHQFSSPRPSPSPTRSRPVVMQNGSSEKQPNPIQRNNDEAGLSKKDDSAQRNMSEMYNPPPPLRPIRVAAEDPRFEKPEKKAPVLSSPNSTASPAVAANGSAHENRSSQRYDPNQSNGDVSRQKSSKDVLNSASSNEIKPKREPIASPPPAPPREDLSADKKPLENGFSHKSESKSKIGDASSDRSESTSRSRGAASHSSLSRHNSRDIEADYIVSKQKTRDADVAPLMQSEKSSRKVPSPPPPPPPPPPPSHADVRLPDPFLQPPPRPHFLDEDNEDHEVDQKADEFIAKFHEQIRLAKAQSYREQLDEGQKVKDEE